MNGYDPKKAILLALEFIPQFLFTFPNKQEKEDLQMLAHIFECYIFMALESNLFKFLLTFPNKQEKSDLLKLAQISECLNVPL